MLRSYWKPVLPPATLTINQLVRAAFCTYEELVGPVVDKEVPYKLLPHLEQSRVLELMTLLILIYATTYSVGVVYR